MPIIITKDGRNARRLERSSFENEDALQRYIHENPDAIPVYELKDEARLLVLAREFPTESGPIDAVGVDREGDLYLVETKLYRNPDKRQVIAQVLDYGAALWSHSTGFDDFTAVLERQCQATFGVGFRRRLQEFFEIGEDEVEALIGALRENLTEGTFRFVVLMDQLHAPLKDLIRFLNQFSKFDVLAVEMEYYRHDSYEILIPKLFGGEVKKDVAVERAASKRQRWDEASFFADAEKKLSSDAFAAVKGMYEFSRGFADRVAWGTGVGNGSFNPKVNAVSARSLYSVYSDGTLSLNFKWLDDLPQSVRWRDLLKAEVEGIPRLRLPAGAEGAHINLTIDEWMTSSPELQRAFETVAEAARSASGESTQRPAAKPAGG